MKLALTLDLHLVDIYKLKSSENLLIFNLYSDLKLYLRNKMC